MPNIAVNNIDLYYEIQGNGEPLLLVAGLAGDSRSRQPIIGRFSQKCLAITPDNRGVGRTTPQDAAMDIRQVADDCIALVEHPGFKRIHVPGHSIHMEQPEAFTARVPDFLH